MYRADGPAEMRPVGEIEFANGVAAMSASGGYGKPRVCAGIVGHADLTLGARVREVLEAMIAAGGGRFRGIRFIRRGHPDQAQWGATAIRPEGLLRRQQGARGLRRSWRRSASASMPGMYHPQLADLIDLARAFPGTTDRAQPCRRPDRARPLQGQARRGVRRVEARASASWRRAPTCT